MLITVNTDVQSLPFDQPLQFDTTSDFIPLLDKVLDYEESLFDLKTMQGKTFLLDFKGQPSQVLITLFEHVLQRESLVNTRLLLNLQLFVNGYSTYDDSLYESPDIYVSDIAQILDIKLAIVDTVKQFRTKCSYWFLACLKSLHKVEYTYLDPIVKLPSLYKRFILSSTLLNMSSILSKSDNIQLKDLPLVEDAFPVIIELASTTAIANGLIQNFDFLSYGQKQA